LLNNIQYRKGLGYAQDVALSAEAYYTDQHRLGKEKLQILATVFTFSFQTTFSL